MRYRERKFKKMPNGKGHDTKADGRISWDIRRKCRGITETQWETFSGIDLNNSIKDASTDYHETVSLQEEISQELIIGFDPRLVIETLKTFDCDNVAVNLETPRMPMIIEAEDSDFGAMVLPVNIVA